MTAKRGGPARDPPAHHVRRDLLLDDMLSASLPMMQRGHATEPVSRHHEEPRASERGKVWEAPRERAAPTESVTEWPKPDNTQDHWPSKVRRTGSGFRNQ